jgi:hypothetical protein
MSPNGRPWQSGVVSVIHPDFSQVEYRNLTILAARGDGEQVLFRFRQRNLNFHCSTRGADQLMFNNCARIEHVVSKRIVCLRGGLSSGPDMKKIVSMEPIIPHDLLQH